MSIQQNYNSNFMPVAHKLLSRWFSACFAIPDSGFPPVEWGLKFEQKVVGYWHSIHATIIQMVISHHSGHYCNQRSQLSKTNNGFPTQQPSEHLLVLRELATMEETSCSVPTWFLCVL